MHKLTVVGGVPRSNSSVLLCVLCIRAGTNHVRRSVTFRYTKFPAPEKTVLFHKRCGCRKGTFPRLDHMISLPHFEFFTLTPGDPTSESVHRIIRAASTTCPRVQGKRTLNSFHTKDLHQIVDIPSGHSTPHSDTFLVVLLLQQTDREAFQPRQVVCSQSIPYATFILTECNVEAPVQTVFDSPVPATRLRKTPNAQVQR